MGRELGAKQCRHAEIARQLACRVGSRFYSLLVKVHRKFESKIE